MITKKCNCGKEFKAYPSRINIGKGKFCSKECCDENRIGKRGYWFGRKRESIWNKGLKTGLIPKTAFKKGHIPWHKGKKGLFLNTGRTHFKKGDGRTAKQNNSMWKGGVTPRNRLERTMPEYYRFVKKVFERDNYTCQICSERGKILNANHIKKFSDYPELRFDINNGITLCKNCHKIVTWHEREWESYFSFNLITRGFLVKNELL